MPADTIQENTRNKRYLSEVRLKSPTFSRLPPVSPKCMRFAVEADALPPLSLSARVSRPCISGDGGAGGAPERDFHGCRRVPRWLGKHSLRRAAQPGDRRRLPAASRQSARKPGVRRPCPPSEPSRRARRCHTSSSHARPDTQAVPLARRRARGRHGCGSRRTASRWNSRARSVRSLRRIARCL